MFIKLNVINRDDAGMEPVQTYEAFIPLTQALVLQPTNGSLFISQGDEVYEVAETYKQVHALIAKAQNKILLESFAVAILQGICADPKRNYKPDVAAKLVWRLAQVVMDSRGAIYE